MKQCSVLDCDRPFLAKKLCNLHYYRVKRGLSLVEPTRFTRRPAVIEGDIAKLKLGNKRGYAIVDAEFSHLDKHNWSLDGRGYPCTWHDGKVVKIHHMILDKPEKGLVIDHINRNPLDNRRVNLRKVTQKDNVRNTGMFSHNTSGYRGVTWDKRAKKWVAQGSFNGTYQYGGAYKTIEEAVIARKKLEEGLGT